jgi:hypothetical protein
LLDNRILISKYSLPLLGNAFANKISSYGNDWSKNRRAVFSVGPCRGVIRWTTGARMENCKGVYEEKI